MIIAAALLGHAALRAMNTTRLYLSLDARLPRTAHTTSAQGEFATIDQRNRSALAAGPDLAWKDGTTPNMII
jgi:hypothetical protein